MALIEIKVEIPAVTADRAEECLLERQEEHWTVLEDVASRRAWLLGIFPDRSGAEAAWAGLEIALGAVGVSPRGAPSSRELADSEWKDSYKAHFQAWKFGPLNWVPVWDRPRYRPAQGEQVLWLDPGMAFGTGNHETTRLCCERLVAYARDAGVDRSMIDAGCGSGILALSAARLGFRDVTAFDNDPLAVEISRANARLNGLEGCVDFFLGDLETGLTARRAELLIANIQADVLTRFAEQLLGGVVPGGRLVLGGILAAEVADVRQAFLRVARDARSDSRILGEWSDLVIETPRAESVG